MKVRTLVAATLCLCAVSAFAASQIFEGKPVQVLASNGVKAALAGLVTQGEKSIGHPLFVHYATTSVHRRTIESGSPFDVAILTSEVTDALIKEGKLSARGRVDVGHSGIGVGIRAGAKKPGIATPDAIKQALLAAKAVTYAEDGASRPPIEKMFETLGIADKMKPKLVLVKGSDASLEAVTSGRADMILTLISEILPVKGVELVGPLPDKFQSYISFSAAVSATAKNADNANQLMKFLSEPKAVATFKAKGIQAGK